MQPTFDCFIDVRMIIFFIRTSYNLILIMVGEINISALENLAPFLQGGKLDKFIIKLLQNKE